MLWKWIIGIIKKLNVVAVSLFLLSLNLLGKEKELYNKIVVIEDDILC